MESPNSLCVSLVKLDLCMGRFIILFTILQTRKKKIQRGQVTCPKSELVNGPSRSPAHSPKSKLFPRQSFQSLGVTSPFAEGQGQQHFTTSPQIRSVAQSARTLPCLTPHHPPGDGPGWALLLAQFFIFKGNFCSKYLWQNTEQDFFHWGLRWKLFSQPADI